MTAWHFFAVFLTIPKLMKHISPQHPPQEFHRPGSVELQLQRFAR
ncbi:hypothetical protein [Bdellovibrio sp. HCB337]